MRNIRTDADHVEIQRAKCENVLGQTFERLAGNADHHAAARFVAQALELPQQRQAVGPAGKAAGMNDAETDFRPRFQSEAGNGLHPRRATVRIRPAGARPG